MESMTNKEMELFNQGADVQKSQTIEAEDGTMLLMQLTGDRQLCYSSMKSETQDQKVALYKAQNSPDKKLKECVNMTIPLKDVYVEIIDMQDQNTGDMIKLPRIVLVDQDGVSYQAVSLGIFKCLSKIFKLFGEPHTWQTPLTVIPKLVTCKHGQCLTLDLASVENK